MRIIAGANVADPIAIPGFPRSFVQEQAKKTAPIRGRFNGWSVG